jgi:Dolichyl-phosphate-mannose-protein mannosyltransferase
MTRIHWRDLLGSKAWIPLTLITGFGCALRLHGFNDYWVSPDEGIYYSMVTWANWGDFYAEYAQNAHPPLYYVLLRLVSVLSSEVWTLRTVSLFFGCCCIPAAFLFARECVGRDRVGTLTGLITSLLIAGSFTAIEMSQLIRPYTMQIACTTFALYYLLRFLRDGGRRTLPAYAALTILATLTHYSTILVIGGTGLALLGLLTLRRLDAAQIRSLAIWHAPVLGVVAAVYFLHIRPDLQDSQLAAESLSTWLKPMLIDGPGDVWPRFLGMLSSAFLAGHEGPASLAFLAGMLWAGYRRKTMLLLLSMSVLVAAIVASAAHKYPFGCSRHNLYLSVIVGVPIAFAIAAGLTSGLRSSVLTITTSVGLLVFHGPVTAGLGSPQLVRDFENQLARKDYADAKPLIDALRNTPGVILMSTQAYYQMLPEYPRDRQNAVFSADRSIRRFRWGRREIIVPDVWAFSVRPMDRGKSDYLYEVVQNIDRHMPDLQLGEQSNVTLFVGSWSTFRTWIVTLGEFVGRTKSVPGFLIAEVDIAGYMALESKRK